MIIIYHMKYDKYTESDMSMEYCFIMQYIWSMAVYTRLTQYTEYNAVYGVWYSIQSITQYTEYDAVYGVWTVYGLWCSIRSVTQYTEYDAVYRVWRSIIRVMMHNTGYATDTLFVIRTNCSDCQKEWNGAMGWCSDAVVQSVRLGRELQIQGKRHWNLSHLSN